MEELEPAFRALADAHRRTLLDRLRERDGQTLGELEAALPQMTRFGVMKHLRVLEDAHLVVTRREGRRKLHFLNPVPIRLIADRWISRYAEPLVEAMAHIKHSVESRTMSESPRHVYEVYIAATPEQVWRALTESEFTKQYYYGNTVESDWKPGSPMVYRGADGRPRSSARWWRRTRHAGSSTPSSSPARTSRRHGARGRSRHAAPRRSSS